MPSSAACRSVAAAMALALPLVAPLEAQNLSPQSAVRVVAAAADSTERGYVFPALGRAVADTLRARAARGSYAGIRDHAALATRLTAELRALSNDRHFAIRDSDAAAPARNPRPRRTSGAEILPDGIGHLRIGALNPELMEQMAPLMSQVSATPALIVDVRDCPGGSAEVMLALVGHLLPERTLLGTIYSREDDSATELWADAPAGSRYVGRPVFVLTSRGTFSACEALAYHLQALRRVSVVGDTTGGGAHRVREVDLGQNLTMMLPYTRIRNVVTGTDWEGTGVIPDLATPTDQALDAARRAAQRAIRH